MLFSMLISIWMSLVLPLCCGIDPFSTLVCSSSSASSCEPIHPSQCQQTYNVAVSQSRYVLGLQQRLILKFAQELPSCFAFYSLEELYSTESLVKGQVDVLVLTYLDVYANSSTDLAVGTTVWDDRVRFIVSEMLSVFRPRWLFFHNGEVTSSFSSHSIQTIAISLNMPIDIIYVHAVLEKNFPRSTRVEGAENGMGRLIVTMHSMHIPLVSTALTEMLGPIKTSISTMVMHPNTSSSNGVDNLYDLRQMPMLIPNSTQPLSSSWFNPQRLRFGRFEYVGGHVDSFPCAQCDVALPAASARRGVAYLYARCDRERRERFFTILQHMMHDHSESINTVTTTMMMERKRQWRVDALGACQGTGHQAVHERRVDRYAELSTDDNYMTRAMRQYANYRFVIAFENSHVSGYITEKLLLPYLVRAVPIYMGAEDVADYFNPASFINCADYSTMDACAHRVIEVNGNETLYRSYLSAAPVLNDEVWHSLFEWSL